MFTSLTPPFGPWGQEGTSGISSRWCPIAATACHILTTRLMDWKATKVYAAAKEYASTYSSFWRFLLYFWKGPFWRQVVGLLSCPLSSSSSTCPLARLDPRVWENSESLGCLATASHGGTVALSKHPSSIYHFSPCSFTCKMDFELF